MKAKLSTDGGARGNPGPAAYGYVLEAEDGTVLDARGETIGERGREERVPELRLETVYPVDREEEVVRALRETHPYEEPAFDLYPLA